MPSHREPGAAQGSPQVPGPGGCVAQRATHRLPGSRSHARAVDLHQEQASPVDALAARQFSGTQNTSPAGIAAPGEVVPANTPLM